jgi:phosphatidylglycerol:prolipoprotein diacylglycerol transferase
MHPFVSILGMYFPTYGILMLLGVGAAFCVTSILCSSSLARGQTVDRTDTLLTCCIIIAGAIIGAASLRPIMKIPEVIIHWETFKHLPMGEIFNYVFGEIVFYGGLIGGAVAAVAFCRFYKIPMLPTLDAIAPAVPLGHAFGRIGCLFAGCCYGESVSYNHPLAIIYPEVSLAAPSGIPLLALPAIEAGGLVLISLIGIFVYVTTRTRGLCVTLYIALYSVLRFALEFFRGDEARGVYGWLSTSQYISLALFAISIVMGCFIFKRRNIPE